MGAICSRLSCHQCHKLSFHVVWFSDKCDFLYLIQQYHLLYRQILFWWQDRFFFGITNYRGVQNNQVLLYNKFKENIVVEWLTLMLHIQEVPDWSLRCCNRFSSVSPGECWDSTLKRPLSFKFIVHLSPSNLMLYSTSHWKGAVQWTTKFKFLKW
jgi:hypothetical protein